MYPNPVTFCIFKLIFWEFSCLSALCCVYAAISTVITELFSLSFGLSVLQINSHFLCVCVSCFSQNEREKVKNLLSFQKRVHFEGRRSCKQKR